MGEARQSNEPLAPMRSRTSWYSVYLMLVGAPPAVCYIDLQSERLLERVELASPRFNTGHLTVTTAGDLAVVSAPRDGLPNPKSSC